MTKRPRCDGDGCTRPATWCVTGRWTVADWLDLYACGEHLLEVHWYLNQRTVDGWPCLERTSQWIGDS